VISSVLSINICRYEHDMIESASQQEHIYKVRINSYHDVQQPAKIAIFLEQKGNARISKE